MRADLNRMSRGWVEGLPELPELGTVRIAETAARSVLERFSPTSTRETMYDLMVFRDLILPRLEGLVQAIKREDRDAAAEYVRIVEETTRPTA
jgi:hypothetical protein